jgi:hypothetical protein
VVQGVWWSVLVRAYPYFMAAIMTLTFDTRQRVSSLTLWETSRWLKRWMLDKARDVHFALVLARLSKIVRRLHS